MFSIVCTCCAQTISVTDECIPPWCPRCGADIQAKVEVPDMAAPPARAKPTQGTVPTGSRVD
jgi:hypothetical protein